MEYKSKDYTYIYNNLVKNKKNNVKLFFILNIQPEIIEILKILIQNMLPKIIYEFKNNLMDSFYNSKEYDERFLEGPITEPPLNVELRTSLGDKNIDIWISKVISISLQKFMNKVHEINKTKTETDNPVNTYSEAQEIYSGFLSIKTSSEILGINDDENITDGIDLITSVCFTIVLESICVNIFKRLIELQISKSVSPNPTLLITSISDTNIKYLIFNNIESNIIIRFCIDMSKKHFYQIQKPNIDLFYVLSKYILNNKEKYNKKQINISNSVLRYY